MEIKSHQIEYNPCWPTENDNVSEATWAYFTDASKWSSYQPLGNEHSTFETNTLTHITLDALHAVSCLAYHETGN